MFTNTQPSQGGLFGGIQAGVQNNSSGQASGLFGVQANQPTQQSTMFPQTQTGLFGGTLLNQPSQQQQQTGGLFQQAIPQQQQTQPLMQNQTLFSNFQTQQTSLNQPQTGFLNQGLQQPGLFNQPNNPMLGGQQNQLGTGFMNKFPAQNTQFPNTGTLLGNTQNQFPGGQVQDDSQKDLQLSDQRSQPADTVSQFDWLSNKPNPMSSFFAASSWDGFIKVFDVMRQQQGYGPPQFSIQQKLAININEPLLCCSFNEMGTQIALGSSKSVILVDTQSQQFIKVGDQPSGVKSVYWQGQNQPFIITCSFDSSIRIWDTRINSQQPAITHMLPNNSKVIVSDYKNNVLAAGLSSDQYFAIDIQALQQQNYIFPLQDSPLGKKSQLSSMAISQDQGYLCLGSIDGRASYQQLLKTSNQQPSWNYNQQFNQGGQLPVYKMENKMTFKCHKIEKPQPGNQQEVILYPVNAIGFNQQQKSFIFTAGGDGNIHFWDTEQKNKIKSLSCAHVPVTAAAMSPDGQFLVYSTGDDYQKGLQGKSEWQMNKIMVHIMQGNELRYQKN